jgi:dCMP deaminase
MAWGDAHFMDLAGVVSRPSKDRSTKVGAVVVGPDNEIRTTGYNSFPRGINDHVEARHERPAKYRWTEHAERNAIYNAARVGTPLKGCRLYVTLAPCMDCARAVIGAGISEVITTDVQNQRWSDEQWEAQTMLEEAGVTLRCL